MTRNTSLHFFTPLNVERAQLNLRERTAANHERLRATANVGLAQNLANLSGFYPSAGAGVLTGASLAGLQPDDPQMAQLATTDLQRQVEQMDQLRATTQNDSSPFLWDALKGVTRGATLAFDFLWEEALTRPIRALVGTRQGLTWDEAYEEAGQSDAMSAIQGFLRGDQVNIGSGFFAQSELSPQTQIGIEQGQPVESAAMNLEQQQLGAPITQTGREQRETGIQLTSPGGVKVPVSPGRILAINFAEPGSTMFNLTSGLTDFSANIFLDPANIVGLGLVKAQKAAKSVVLTDSMRKGVLSRSWRQYVDSRDGRDAVRWFTNQTEMEPVLGALKSSQAFADVGLANRLVNSVDDVSTASLLRDGYRRGALENALTPTSLSSRLVGVATGSGRGGTFGNRPIRRALATTGGAIGGSLPGGMGATAGAAAAFRMSPIAGLKRSVGNVTKDTYLGYLSTRLGARGLSVHNIDQAVDDFGENLVLMGIDRASRNELLARLATTEGNGPGMFGVVKDAVEKFSANLVTEGIHPQVAKSVTKIYKDYNGMRAYWLNKVGEPQFFPGAQVKVMSQGDVVTMPSAMLFNEMMEQFIPILDAKKVRLAMRQASKARVVGKRAFKDWDEIGDRALVRYTDNFMNKVWKPLVLLRGAWTVRVVGEEQIRMAALGLNSQFRHPLQYMSMYLAGGKAEDVTGLAFDDARDFQSMLSSRINLFDNRTRTHTTSYRKAAYGDPEFWKGRGFEYDQLTRDPIAIAVTEAIQEGISAGKKTTGFNIEDVLTDVKARFRDGDLASLRHQMTSEGGRMSAQQVEAIAQGYIDATMARIVDITGGRFIYNEAWGVQADDIAGTKTEGLRFKVPGTEDELTFGGRERWFDQYNNEISEQQLIEMGAFDAWQPGEQIVRGAPTGLGSRTDVEGIVNDLGSRLDINIGNPNVDPLPILDDIRADIQMGFGEAFYDSIQDELSDQFDHLVDRWRRADPNDFDAMEDFDQAVTQFGDFLSTKLDNVSANRPLSEVSTAQEFIPTAEALRLADMNRADFDSLLATFKNEGRLDPIDLRTSIGPAGRREVADGTYIMDGLDDQLIGDPITDVAGLSGQYGTVLQVRDNHVVGFVSFKKQADSDGFQDVMLFKTADPNHPLASRGDSAKLLNKLSDLFGGHTPDDVLNMVMRSADDIGQPARRVTLKQYLQALGVDEGLESTDDIIAAIRRTAGGRPASGAFPGLAGSTPISATGGARTARSQLGISKRLPPDDPQSIAALPQGRPQMVVTEMGDPDLLEGIVRGKLGDIQFRDLEDPTAGLKRRKLKAPKPGSKDYDRNQRSMYQILEDTIGDRAQDSWTKVAVKESGEQMNSYDRALENMFDLFMGSRTDNLSRSPAFKQFYWKRISALYPHLDEAGRKAALAQMKKEGITGRSIREQATDLLRGRSDDFAQIDRLAGAGRRVAKDIPILDDALTLAEADEVAKAFALHEVRDLLYDISRKHNFFEMTRNIFPFGEAWLEIVTRWAKIVQENPRLIRRFQQGLQGARESGWIYNDPQTGEEVFNYPGSGLLSSWMFGDSPTGAGFQLTGRVQGLNLMLGQYMPGFGPVVQIPASTLARDYLEDPNQRFLRDLLLPFGFTDVDSMGDIIDTVGPSWLKKGLTALGKPTGDDLRLYNNTVIDVMRAGSTSGIYDLTSQEGYQHALGDAKAKAKYIYAVRSIGAFVAPTSPGVRWEASDINGQLFSFATLAEEYRRILDENQGSQTDATTEFVTMFGLDPTVFTTPKTVSLARRSVTEPGNDYRITHPELFINNPLSAYYTRPDGPDEEFDYNAYLSQLREGTREELSPEQWAFERNDLLGRVAYERARQHAADNTTPEARQWLRDYRLQLMERYEGFNSPVLGIPERGTREAVIREMSKWHLDSGISATDAGQGVIRYMEARQQAIDRLVEEGYSPSALQNSNAGRIYRDWLRLVAQQVMNRNPDFLPSWIEVFSREIEDDDPEFIPSFQGVDLNG